MAVVRSMMTRARAGRKYIGSGGGVTRKRKTILAAQASCAEKYGKAALIMELHAS